MNEAGKALKNRLPESGNAIQAFKDWRAEFPATEKVDAAGLSLKDLDLSGTDWTNIELDKAIFVRCTLDDSEFGGAHGSLYRAQFKWGSYERIVLNEVDCRYLEFQAVSLDGARFTDVNFDNAVFLAVSLCSTKFNRCRLAHTRLENCSADDQTHFSNSVSTKNLRVNQSFVDSLMNRGGLSDPQLAAMIVADDIAALRVKYGGAYAWVHAVSLVIFVLPYAFFIAHRLILAASHPPLKTDPRLYEALLGFILTAGDNWQRWQVDDIAWFSVIAFVFVAVYNAGRLILLLAVYGFERHEAVFRRRTQYRLNAQQKKVWIFVQYGYWINLFLIALNTAIFMSTRVPA